MITKVRREFHWIRNFDCAVFSHGQRRTERSETWVLAPTGIDFDSRPPDKLRHLDLRQPFQIPRGGIVVVIEVIVADLVCNKRDARFVALGFRIGAQPPTAVMGVVQQTPWL